jgi:hypothetical protein
LAAVTGARPRIAGPVLALLCPARPASAVDLAARARVAHDRVAGPALPARARQPADRPTHH